MRIRGAIGLGITIIVLRVLAPVIFGAIQDTALAFLRGAQLSANAASAIAGSIGTAAR
jgi:uncharacterized membrane protein (DUF441 family)